MPTAVPARGLALGAATLAPGVPGLALRPVPAHRAAAGGPRHSLEYVPRAPERAPGAEGAHVRLTALSVPCRRQPSALPVVSCVPENAHILLWSTGAVFVWFILISLELREMV